MAATTIANLWTPDEWIQGANERMNTLPSLISSPIVKRVPEFDALAAGGGVSVNVPYFRDITDQDDAPQIEGSAPTIQNLTGGKQIAPVLNRATGIGVTGLAVSVSATERQMGDTNGGDPVANILSQIAVRRQKQRQKTLVNILRGIFGFSAGPSAATGALYQVRNDVFLEAGANPASNQLISPFAFADTLGMLGELADTTLGGGILMHPLIRVALIKQDQIAFEHYSLQSGTLLSGPAAVAGGAQTEFYKGYRVFVSNLLVRAGTGGGYVFDTYIFGAGVFAWGEKPQIDGAQAADAASMRLWVTPDTNEEDFYDRCRFILHPNGIQWKGTPGGQSASNAELATAGNWALDYTTADRCAIVCLRSNG